MVWLCLNTIVRLSRFQEEITLKGVVEFALMRCLVPHSAWLNLITLFYIRLYINIHMHVCLTSTIGHIKEGTLVFDKVNEPKQVWKQGFC